MLSRNFRLQKVGGLDWLKSNYNFSQIAYSIDELVVLDISRGQKNLTEFCTALKRLAEDCFVPIAAGGGVCSTASAHTLLRSGADKIVVNSALFENSNFIDQLASEFGRQCIVASMDVKESADGSYQVWSNHGTRCLDGAADNWVRQISHSSVGELYLNSIDRDGTGQGYDLGVLNLLPADISIPLILAGGVGNAAHLAVGLADSRVDAVATANLFNFIGDGLTVARESLIAAGVQLPVWDTQFLQKHLNHPHSGASD